MSHSFEEHTADVRVRIESGSLSGLFEEAARALGELLAEGLGPPEGPPERIELEGVDAADLLVRWFDELIYLSDTKKLVFANAHVVRADPRSLVATVRGAPARTERTAVKAATYHDLCVEETAGRWSALLVLDV